MAINNIVTLIGNMGSEARIIETEESRFAAFSLATTDSYKDEAGEWHDKDTVWHNILAFNPRVIEGLKAIKKGSRIKVSGSLYYRPFEVMDGAGEVITKKEASILAVEFELAPLIKKKQQSS